MKISALTIAALVAVALITPANAAGYIPLGPKVYTPQPPIITPQDPIVTPQPDLVETTPGYTLGGDPAPIANTDDPYKPGWWNEKCKTFAYVNADCTVQSLNPGNLGARVVPAVTTTTPQSDIVTPQPDLVTPQPDSCKQKGLGSSGLGWYSC